MNKKSLKFKRYIVLLIFVVTAIVSVLITSKVNINYNISDYLAEDTETKISLNIIEEEFGMTGDIQVMVEDVDVDTAKEIQNIIKNIPNVLTVNFNENDENYYKDNKALFAVIVDGDEYSDIANTVLDDIADELDEEFTTNYGGSVVSKRNLRKAIQSEIVMILAIALCLVIILMLLTSSSWLEPFVLLLASGVAILMNMGTNILFGEISYITNAVSAILQLALSIDYSIVLLHGYNSIRATEDNSGKAMIKAIKSVIKPVAASALTTITGLLALLFMTMKIGFDIGIVLMKGITISAIVALTLLPALLLILEKPMQKTAKRAIVIGGEGFCKLAIKAGKVIVPVALAIIIVCGFVQSKNTYSFTDSSGDNNNITDTFGKNQTVIVVYPNKNDDYQGENALGEKLMSYKTEDGKQAVKSYTAYSNTVREIYDIDKAVQKLKMPEKDVEMLFVMYHLYGDSSRVELTPLDFVKYTEELAENDADAQGFMGEDTAKTVRTLMAIDEIMNGEHTAEQFLEHTSDMMPDSTLSLFAIKQMYGLYYFDSITEKKVDFETVLDFAATAAKDGRLDAMLDADAANGLIALSDGVDQFKEQMDKPMSRADFKEYMLSERGETISEGEASLLYLAYSWSIGAETMPEEIPFLSLMNYLVSSGRVTAADDIAKIDSLNKLYADIPNAYGYDEFVPMLEQAATTLTGETTEINADDLAIQQLYIMYFYEQEMIPDISIDGREFVDFVIETSKTNSVVSSQLPEDTGAKLDDICTVDSFLLDKNTYDFKEMTERITELQGDIKSISASGDLGESAISGVYIKYAISEDMGLSEPIMACDLLDFVVENMDSNGILKAKMSDEARGKLSGAQEAMAGAQGLLIGENYSRMLLSVDLPNESAESSAFVEYLLSSVKETLGEDAHIAGEMVSTYDLQETFDDDNKLISIFTIVSIFITVMMIFKSLSLPIILSAVIQGAIWIAMSTSLITGPMFFMSYIMATCILMGSTIDYGILMSTNYVEYRATMDKKEALNKSVKAAMPTVFTSGLILTICGFVVGFIASQNSISTVGVLIGKGTLVSTIMITVVLPAILYLLDGFILKLSMKSKKIKKSEK